LAFCRVHGISGQRLHLALGEFAVHGDLSKLNTEKEDASFLDPIIQGVMTEHAEKIKASDPDKILNFLVGQVMKKCKGQRVDAAALKSRLGSLISMT
jgi:Asp-tRNA(Asn)/Glu-tRNA(Gln) amidotransferase B subunit